MLYFSEIKNKKIITEDGVEVGKLNDLIFNATETPKITKLSITNKDKEELIVPLSYLKKVNDYITIYKNYVTEEVAENELYIKKSLLDRQIIDIKGNKVIRVNDVLIQDKQGFIVSGVDVGFLGILRWLRLENYIFNLFKTLRIRIVPKILSWVDIQPLELSKGKVMLKKEEEKLEKIAPEDLADYLEKTNVINVRKILNMLDEEFAAEVIGSLNINYQTELFKHFSPRKASRVINLIDPDEAVDILLTLSKKRRERIIEILSDEKKRELEYLLNLSKTPIGEMITSEFLTVPPEYTAKQVIDHIRKETSDFSFLTYIYVVNANKQLVGVFNLHELIMQHDDTPVYKFMVQNTVVIHLTTPKELAFKKLFKYKVESLPVIDQNKQILGIITFDDMSEFALNKI